MPIDRRNLLIVLALCGGSAIGVALIIHPRPVTPRFPPALVLQANAVAEQIKKDQEFAQCRTQIRQKSQADELEALFMQSGEAEQGGLEDSTRIRKRRKRIAELVEVLNTDSGPRVLDLLRAAATEELSRILAGNGQRRAANGYMGTFPNLLTYHHAAWKGRRTAPLFVIRTLYKARWNTLHGLDHSTGFSAIETQAYFGWLALHADRLPLSIRLSALPAYAAAGGERADEAAGVLLYSAGQFSKASQAFRKALKESYSLRVRNYLLASELARPSH